MSETARDLRGRMLGRFVLRERITGGGFGTVYRCEQLWLGREVVVKVLHEWLTELEQKRFRREAELASRLDHPYAAHVYAFGVEEDEGLFWIAMELVPGVSLSRWLRKHGQMSLEQLVPFFERIAEVVQTAHERGIVHRDLKPSNVMVVERDGSLFPKLLDLGIAMICHDAGERSMMESGPDGSATGTLTARLRTMRPPRSPGTHVESGSQGMAERLTPSNILLGSPPYMAPEQWSNTNAVGPATDIYALGIVVYEALTGYVPFVAATNEQWYQRHRYGLVPPLRPPALDEVIQRALAKEPHERQGSVQELASELRGVLRASPREQLRASAQRWEDQGRPRGLLWGADMLEALARWPRASSSEFTEVERAFVATSRRHVRLAAGVRYFLAALAVVVAVVAVWYRVATEAQTNRRLLTRAQFEQGRSALLHGEPDAGSYLAKVYQQDPSRRTEFMLARALQPWLAEQARFASSSGRMWSATFSPDGKQIVTTDDKHAQVWNAQTHRLLFTLAHSDTVYHAVYSADSTKILTAGGDGVIGIWNAENGSSVRKLAQPRRDGKPWRYVIAAVSFDGHVVAAIDLLGEVAHAWDADTGAPLAELRNDASGFSSLAFSADGRWLATSGGNDVRVFDTRTWARVLTLAGPRIHSLAFEPTGPRLVTGSTDGDATVWAVPSGERVHHLRDVGEPIDAVAFSPDGELVVTASHDGAEHIWDAQSGKLRSQLTPRHSPVLSAEFDRTSKLVLAASSDGAVTIVDVSLGMPVTVLEGPANIVAAHFDPSSRLVVGASLDGTARVWDATSPYRRWSSPPISDDCGIGTSPQPDRRFIAVGCRDHKTRVWDTLHDRLLAELPSVTHVDGDWTSAFPAVSADGDRAAIARDNAVEIYELPGNRLLRTIRHPAAVNAVAFAGDGHDLVSGAIDGSLLVTRDGREPMTLPTSPEGIDAAGFLADGRVAATAGKQLRIYDLGRTAVLADLELPGRVMALRTSPDGRRLITIPTHISTPTPLALWDLEHHRMVTLLEGHVGRVFSARFAGDALLTAGGDRTVRLWDGATGRLRQIYRGGMSSGFFADAALSPDGSMVVAGDRDGLLWFWDVADEHPIWTLQAYRSHLIGLHFEGPDLVTRGFAGEVSRWTLPQPEQVIETCRDRQACAIVAK
jgi:WD40 repeat protein/serine/threonine protein kinase